MSGTLFIVATPIGNLADISQRALDTLRGVSLIACEDTRHTAKLLSAHGIATPTLSLHEHNERRRTESLIEKLKSGSAVALVSDAGTPLVSDPGWWLVHTALEAGIPLAWIPGPSAVDGALVLSGLPCDRFVFEGFLPPKSAARRRRLEALKGEERTVIVFESPHRVRKTVRDIMEVIGDVPLACMRELTKRFEETIRGTAASVAEALEARPPRGEYVLAWSARPRRKKDGIDD